MQIAVTGHRPNKLGNEYLLIGPNSDRIRVKLQAVIDQYKDHIPTLISGMALGVDQIWAQLATTNHLPWIAAIPCYDGGTANCVRYARQVNRPILKIDPNPQA